MQRSLTWLYESIASPNFAKVESLKLGNLFISILNQPSRLHFKQKLRTHVWDSKARRTDRRKKEGTWNYPEFIFCLSSSFNAIFFWSTRSTCFLAWWVSWWLASIKKACGWGNQLLKHGLWEWGSLGAAVEEDRKHGACCFLFYGIVSSLGNFGAWCGAYGFW